MINLQPFFEKISTYSQVLGRNPSVTELEPQAASLQEDISHVQKEIETLSASADMNDQRIQLQIQSLQKIQNILQDLYEFSVVYLQILKQ